MFSVNFINSRKGERKKEREREREREKLLSETEITDNL